MQSVSSAILCDFTIFFFKFSIISPAKRFYHHRIYFRSFDFCENGEERGKIRNRSETPEIEASVVRISRGSVVIEDPELEMAKQQRSLRSDGYGGHGSMSRSSEASDSPLCLQSSDHPGLMIVAHTLDGTNYNSWAIAMRISLDAKNKLSFIDGSLPRPSESDFDFKIWSRCNSMVKSWILNVVSKEIYDSILYYQDAVEMWNDLFTRFKVNNLPRRYQLEQAVMTLRQGQLDLSSYFTKKKTLWEQLANTKSRTVKRCDCDQVKELLEEAETSRIIQFLMGLNDDFNNIRSQILNMKPRPGLNEIYNILDQDESQRVVGVSSRPTSNPVAFQSQASQAVIPDQNSILLAQGNFQKPKCSHCSRIGHVADTCYKLHGYPPGHPRAKKNNYVGSTNLASAGQIEESKDQLKENVNDDLSKEQLQQMISYLSTKLQSSSVTSCPEKAIASTSTSVPTISQISGTFLSLYDLTFYDMLTSSIPHETELSFRAWVIDSGASHHVTHERNLYRHYKPLDKTFVRLPNGQTVKIDGTGYIQLTDSLSLHNVLHIPEFKFNLLSALTQDLMIGKGSQVANLYVLSQDKSLVNMSCSAFQGVPIEYWGDCVLTAVFLINRLPSPVIGNKTPFERLTSTTPDYNSLKAFGCYPSGFKGYKLLDIETYSVSISRHVIFYEDIFPFASSNISDDVKNFFPHITLPAQITDDQLPLVQTSSDAPHHLDESSSMVSIKIKVIVILPSPVIGNKTPFERLTSTTPDYNSLKAFGCLCYCSTSPKSRTKFDPRAKACVFLGYPSGFKGYKLLDIETYSVSISRHVIFYEDIFPFASSNISDDVKNFFPHITLPAQITDDQLPLVQTSSDAPHHLDESSSMVSVPSELKPTRQRKLPSHLQDFHCYNNNTLTKTNTSPYPLTNYISYSYVSQPFCAFINAIAKSKIPKKISEARLDKVWVDAARKEIGAFIRTKTLSVCDLPDGKVAVGCKWVFTIKYHADGSIERHKARLVAKGYTQREGIDFTDTFSPVAKMATVKMIFSLAPKMQWFLHQLDISNAFLNGDLDEEIYMKLPPGYAELQGEVFSPNAVCRLHKSIYGLKQASRQWFLKFKTTLVGFGFDTCHGDHTLFMKEDNGQFLVVLVYVDDILIATMDSALAYTLRDQLSLVFQLRDLGTPKYFLGIEIARNDEGICLTQRKYVLDLLETTGFSDCKPSDVPMKPDQQMSLTSFSRRKKKKVPPVKEGDDEYDVEPAHPSDSTLALLTDTKQYRRLIGKLQYLTITRLDITFSVSKLAQYSSAPWKFHLQAAHKVLRYLKDWGACPDSRRSVTGFAIFIGHSLVSWRSKKQDMVSMSSAESEYRAMSVITKELLWFTYILKSLRLPFSLPAYLYCDNEAAIHIASNSVYHERTKHIEFDCHKVREAIEDGVLKTMFVRTDNQLADILTKALPPALFNANIGKMGVLNIYSSPS
ncbi:PREDICTED: uncharacterized protein LOC109127935 [Camelina sativa]|uniref:Uncharacterized protein LOC109127935 n=1 Tax=Camelina sativa TaxID=90675 RepID=A0ABM1QQQ5_CAMSA|nr:PREDICTED: uncharacterized protein LOC109127935 [Camelina sativa]